MRVASLLLGTVLFVSVTAKAQGPAGAGAGSGSPHFPRIPVPSASGPIQAEKTPWQVAVSFQYNYNNLLGSPFTTYGINVTATRFLTRYWGVDTQIGTGFYGNTGQTTTPPNLDAKSLFLGVGPRLAIRGRSRFEPWGHAVGGFEHFRFSQTAGVLGSNNALAGAVGGGADFFLTPRAAVRVEADAIGSEFFSTHQRHFQALLGVVYNF
jgi:hypothetical protein